MSSAAKTTLIAIPWVAVVVLAVVAQGLHRQNTAMRDRAERLQMQLTRQQDALQETAKAASVEAQEVQDRQDARDARIAELEGSLEELQARYDDAVNVSAAPDDDGEAEKSPMANMLGGFSEEMARSTASTQVSLFYKDFLNELNVDAETRDIVREILNDFKGAETWDQILVARGELTQEEVEATDYPGQLRDALSAVLPDQELAYYDEYEDGMQERMIRQSYDMQLSMFAGELTEENRALALDFIVDEMSALEEAGGAPTNTEDGQAAQFQGVIDMFDSVSAQLFEILPEDQYAAFERFAEQQANQMRLVQQMFDQSQEAGVQ
jgi:hypothetical protein